MRQLWHVCMESICPIHELMINSHFLCHLPLFISEYCIKKKWGEAAWVCVHVHKSLFLFYFLDINTLECWDSRFPGLFTVCRGSFFSKRALCQSQQGCRMLGGVCLSACFCSPPLIDACGLYHAQKEQRETNRTSTERKLDFAEDTVRGKAAATFTEDTSTS